MNVNLSIFSWIFFLCVFFSLVWPGLEYYHLRKATQSDSQYKLNTLSFIIGLSILILVFSASVLLEINLTSSLATWTTTIKVFVQVSAGLAIICLALILKNRYKNYVFLLSSGDQIIQASSFKKTDHSKPNPTTDFFQQSPSLYLVIDHQQDIVDANPSLAAFLNTTIDELKTKNIKDLVMSDDHTLLKDITPARVKNALNENHLSLRLARYENEPLWIKLRATTLNWNANYHEHCLVLLQDNREAKNLAELISFHSQYDELTMLHNRESMESYLSQVLEISKENNSPVALFYIDVDQLKVVNDTCGHTAGDRLLQYLVTVLGDASPECNFFARIGGDEFVLVKVNSNEQEALTIAEHLRNAAEDFIFVWRDHNYRQSISVGVALSSSSINDVINLVGAADSACYTAKLNGKNRVVLYSESIAKSQDNHRHMLWVSRLQHAIQDGQFILYFHPIHRLSASSTAHIHYELLIRYVDEHGNHILPKHFLPAVERFGLSEQIDLWVLKTALAYLDKHPEHTDILDCCSINLTSQSIANPRIRSAILHVVQNYTFLMHKLCFEITESSAIQNLKEAQEFIGELKAFGCKLALDDFGTGFSSFGYLKHLDVDYIKIDGSFVRDITNDRFDRAMVAAINNIGKEMGIEIIAEYAEKEAILEILREMDVGYAQGYAIAKPLPIDNLKQYYSEPNVRS